MVWEKIHFGHGLLQSNQWDGIIETTNQSAQSCTEILVATEFARAHYEPFGKVSQMRLGLDTSVFCPLSNKK